MKWENGGSGVAGMMSATKENPDTRESRLVVTGQCDWTSKRASLRYDSINCFSLCRAIRQVLRTPTELSGERERKRNLMAAACRSGEPISASQPAAVRFGLRDPLDTSILPASLKQMYTNLNSTHVPNQSGRAAAAMRYVSRERRCGTKAGRY